MGVYITILSEPPCVSRESHLQELLFLLLLHGCRVHASCQAVQLLNLRLWQQHELPQDLQWPTSHLQYRMFLL